MKADSTGAPYPEFVWNHAVHERRNELLLFWRLGFYPSFLSADVVAAIEAVVEGAGIRGAVLYEVFGIHDLFLRVWIPHRCPLERFRKTLVDALEPHSLKTCDAFIVNDPVRHWLFPEGRPSDGALSGLGRDEELAVEDGSIEPARRREMVSLGLLADFPAEEPRRSKHPPPIKFAVVVVGQPQLGVRQLQQFERTVTGVLDGARAIEQPSLYSGFGFGHFLILGAVEPTEFFAIDEELISGLNDAHIQEVYESRTYTYVSGVRRFLLFREGLAGPVEEAAEAPAPGPSTLPDSHRFEHRQTLGRGGFSPVYRVFDNKEQREWAMKVFPPEHAAAAEREVRALLRFNEEPRVVRVHSYHEEAATGRAYLLMEYIEGVALDRHLAGGRRVEDSFAVSLVISLLKALEVIHPDQTEIDEIRARPEISEDDYNRERSLQERALVHRDIKPANVMLLADGSIKLIDFNISSPPGEPVGTRSGTPRYLAPDATNDVWDVSVDLFATGVILYELICGAHPYPNDEPNADFEPVDPRRRRPDLPSDLSWFLVKACMPLRADRFASAKEMRSELERISPGNG